jgi:hypothetical protein
VGDLMGVEELFEDEDEVDDCSGRDKGGID